MRSRHVTASGVASTIQSSQTRCEIQAGKVERQTDRQTDRKLHVSVMITEAGRVWKGSLSVIFKVHNFYFYLTGFLNVPFLFKLPSALRYMPSCLLNVPILFKLPSALRYMPSCLLNVTILFKLPSAVRYTPNTSVAVRCMLHKLNGSVTGTSNAL